MQRCRPTLWLVCLGLLAAVGCKSKPELDVQDPPSLDGESSQAVLLRYTFVAGDRYSWSSEATMDMDLEAEGQAIDAEMAMVMGGSYRVDSVDAEGNGTVTVETGRLLFDMDMAGISMTYDSDDPSGASPEMSQLGELVNQALTLTISPQGAISEEDLSTAMRTFGGGGMMGAGGTREVINNSFVAFSDSPVRVGERFGSGSITLPGAQGDIEISARYEVLSISADGKQVLLKPHIDLSSAFAAVPGMSVGSYEFDGWMLFDVERGLMTESAMGIAMAFSVDQGDDRGSGLMAVNMTYTTSDFARGSATAPPPRPGNSQSVPEGGGSPQ